ncbi:hypothetical protein Tco_0139446 [Tanacetum coccineum]
MKKYPHLFSSKKRGRGDNRALGRRSLEPNQHDDVPVVPEPVLVDEDEAQKEEEFEEEEEPQEEEDDDMEVNI